MLISNLITQLTHVDTLTLYFDDDHNGKSSFYPWSNVSKMVIKELGLIP